MAKLSQTSRKYGGDLAMAICSQSTRNTLGKRRSQLGGKLAFPNKAREQFPTSRNMPACSP